VTEERKMQPADEPAQQVPEYDATALVEVLGLSYHLGSAMERILVGASEGDAGAPRLREAAWSLRRYASILEERPMSAELRRSVARLARVDDAIRHARALSAALAKDNGEPER
jgi:predicted signal transduction protein with EAL and GGDEF domain